MTLTEEQIRAMEPGFGMDLAVAQALGVPIIGFDDGVDDARWWRRSDGINVRPVHYSTDPGEAFKALTESGLRYELRRFDFVSAETFWCTSDGVSSECAESATGDIARDICVCILLAKMVEK